MKIILDPQIFHQQKYGGISRYYTEIFSIISKKEDVEIKIPFYTTSNVYLNENRTLLDKHQKISKLLVRIFTFFGISIRKKVKKQNAKLFAKAMQQDYDLFIPTYYDDYFLDYLNEKPFVLTVYDMIHELYPECFKTEALNIVENKKKLIEKATNIIAVSNNTKKDILKFYPLIDPSKIEVIYHGNTINVDETVEVELPKKYLLFVGVRPFYKNFFFLLESIKDILKADSDLYLICAGGGKFSEEENLKIINYGLENKVIQTNFKENELGTFYKNARCFIFPSIYEGFGIPVLESMACGCPIVLGNHSSFPEVAGEAGVYFDINDLNDLKEKVNYILNNEKARNEFIQKGYEQVSKFDWEIAAEKCLKLYKKSI